MRNTILVIAWSRVVVFGRLAFGLALLLAVAQSLGAQESEVSPVPAAGEDVFVYLSVISTSPPTLVLSPIGRPNSANQWTVSWTGGGAGVVTYELQESPDTSFSITNTYTQTATSKLIQHAPSPANTYYYRVRAQGSWGDGFWSNVESVMGGYRDDFDDPYSGWAMRRTTYLKRVLGTYVNGSYEILANDGYDWGIFSPLRPAPSLPYAIEFRSKIDFQTIAASHGAVFGGDWTGAPCPDYGSVPGIYEHDICFNHFYNPNLIWYVGTSPAMQLLFERVDYLVWCPACGGSPMKRLTNDSGSWFSVNPVPNAAPNDWNIWRVEVRENGLRLYANSQEFASSADTGWVNEPYFGLFVSSNEYEPARWLVDYYQVTYLDN